jgi:hypothetical protein
MALTPAEKQRRYRERKKAEQKLAGDMTRPFLKEPFFVAAAKDPNWAGVEANLDLAGFELPTFQDDSGPKSFTGTFDEDGTYDNYSGSIGRAEIMLGGLLDTVTELAGIINRYKRKEIADRIHEIETADLSDPEKRIQALADIVRLKKMLDQLDRQVRWGFPQWEVKGE